LTELLKNEGYKIIYDCENDLDKLFIQYFQSFKQLDPMTLLTNREEHFIKNVIGIKRHASSYLRMYLPVLFLFNHDQSQPFFLLKWIIDPHSPYNPPSKFIEKIQIDKSKLNLLPETISTLTDVSSQKIKKWNLHEQKYLNELYKKEVASVDERIGFIINAIKYKGMLDNTFIVFTSDHGEAFGEHGEWYHGQNFYDELVHVPLIITGPKILKAKREKRIVSLVDLMPTITDLLQIKQTDSNIQGKSFAHILFDDDAVLEKKFAYLTQPINDDHLFQDALLEDEHKLILYQNNNYLLYNLADDPEELFDISENNNHIVNKMLTKVQLIRKDNLKRKTESTEKPKPVIDQETIEQLKGLGYLR